MTRQRKSGTRSSRRTAPKSKKPTNGAPDVNGRPKVGTTKALSKEDSATVTILRDQIRGLEQQLGAKRADYAAFEAAQLARLSKAQEEYKSLVMTVAKKHNASADGESWQFSPDKMAFTRTA